ncbi:LPXTG cell wall anchor domain-containing protein [Fructilactobacillus florum]|uniref:Uncharacterized protein n=3 Tax=Fructilactobacillus florum TaxID=640331 RepID=A0A0R2CLR2_9LACO|nr:LPXTG cell wall anchor domain-containing protein [Fructilactobacillus florum]KRM92542.1 hypothetical protein FC87_GL000154 [Fructilactobacillus florum DSM 22689 = JCM 16035]
MNFQNDKIHYKMYKAKGKWVYAGITTMVVTGGFLFLNQGAKVHADQANQATATQQDQSDRSTVSNDSLASTSVAAEPDSANLSVQSQATTSQAATSEATTSQTTDSIGNSTSTETSSVSASKPSEQVSNAPVESAQVAPVSQTTSSQASVASATQSEATGSQVVTSQQPQVSEKSVMPSTMTLAAENGETFNANVTDPDYPAGKWQDPNSDHYTFGYLKTDGTSQPVENVVFSTNRNGDGTVYIYEFDAQNNLLNSYTLTGEKDSVTSKSNPGITYTKYSEYSVTASQSGSGRFSKDWFYDDNVISPQYSNIGFFVPKRINQKVTYIDKDTNQVVSTRDISGMSGQDYLIDGIPKEIVAQDYVVSIPDNHQGLVSSFGIPGTKWTKTFVGGKYTLVYTEVDSKGTMDVNLYDDAGNKVGQTYRIDANYQKNGDTTNYYYDTPEGPINVRSIYVPQSNDIVYYVNRLAKLVPVNKATGEPFNNGDDDVLYETDPNDRTKIVAPKIPNIPGFLALDPRDPSGKTYLKPGDPYPVAIDDPGTDTQVQYIEDQSSISGNNKTITVGDAVPTAEELGAAATDPEGNPIAVTVDTSQVNNQVPGDYPVTITSADGQTKTVTVTVVPNEQTIDGNNAKIAVGDRVPTAAELGASATDKHGNPIDVTVDTSQVNNQVPGDYPVTITSADGQTKTVTVTVVPNEQTIDGNNATITAGDRIPTASELGVSATDKFGNPIDVTVDTSQVNNQVPGDYPVTLTTADGQTKTITITVLPNKQKIDGNNATITVGDRIPTASELGVSATDKFGNPIDVTVDTSQVNNQVPGNYPVTLTTADGQTKTVIVTVLPKKNDVNRNGLIIHGNNAVINVGSRVPTASELGIYVTDQFGNPVRFTADFSQVNPLVPGTYPVIITTADGQVFTIMITVVGTTPATINSSLPVNQRLVAPTATKSASGQQHLPQTGQTNQASLWQLLGTGFITLASYLGFRKRKHS